MSVPISPVTEKTNPFVPTTTEAIERANRLISLTQHPGFLDLIRISQDLVKTAQDVSTDFGGWDPAQIVTLKVRSQAAKEHHNLFMARIKEAIEVGITEARDKLNSLPEKTAAEAIEQGDYVRQRVLQQFDEADMRSAGSYGPPDEKL